MIIYELLALAFTLFISINRIIQNINHLLSFTFISITQNNNSIIIYIIYIIY